MTDSGITQPQSVSAPACYICGDLGRHYDPDLGAYVCDACLPAVIQAGQELALAGLPHSSLTAPAWPGEETPEH